MLALKPNVFFMDFPFDGCEPQKETKNKRVFFAEKKKSKKYLEMNTFKGVNKSADERPGLGAVNPPLRLVNFKIEQRIILFAQRSQHLLLDNRLVSRLLKKQLNRYYYYYYDYLLLLLLFFFVFTSIKGEIHKKNIWLQSEHFLNRSIR